MRGEFKVYKFGDFTVMPIVHLKDKTLSLKAVGLLSKMLSLPDDWDYSLNGLVAITKDGLDSVRSALNELKDHDYVEILKLRTNKGTSTVVLAADDPLSIVNNLSNFIFGLIRAVGMIILGFSIVQIGLFIKSHDPSQRANGFLTLAGGIVITFAKEILNMITGG